MIKKLYAKYVLAIYLIMASSIAIAAGQQKNPIDLLKNVSTSVMSELTKNKSTIASDPSKLFDLIQRFIIPNVDFVEMGTWIAGRKAWSQASSAQKNEFIKQFKILVVKTYGSALVGYSDNKVVFPPQEYDPSKERIEIMSWVKRPSNDDVRVKYRLIKSGASWKVYDLEVEGVSILRGFMAQFSEEIKTRGLSVAIEQMKEHNAK